jgi:hypothetical protein
MEPIPTTVAESFDASVVREALREVQALVPGYTYKGFCAKVAGPVAPDIWSPCGVDGCSITAELARPTLNISLGRNRWASRMPPTSGALPRPRYAANLRRRHLGFRSRRRGPLKATTSPSSLGDRFA